MGKRLLWLRSARPEQLAPEGDWRTWLVLAGRGFGKTKTAAEDTWHYCATNPGVRVALVAPTARDLRITCIEGDSGLINTCPHEMLLGGSPDTAYNKSMAEIKFANGSIVQGFSAEEPGRLRGPQFHRAWGDEVAAWQRADETWDMLMFGLRLGDDPRVIATTTPKPIPLMRRIINDPRTVVTGGSSYENAANLAKPFLDDLKRYEGTELGRQEIHAELLDLSANAILKRKWWQPWTLGKMPETHQIVISLDTAYKEAEGNSRSACTVWGSFEPDEGREMGIILLDAWADRLAYPSLKEKVLETITNWTIDGERPDYVLIEDKGSGQSLIQELQMAGIPVRPYNPGKDSKILRAHVQSDLLASGRIWAPGKKLESGGRSDKAFAPKAEMVVAECEAFRGVRDEVNDLVDTCTQAWALMRDIGVLDLPTDEVVAEAGDDPGSPFDDDEARPETGGDEGYF